MVERIEEITAVDAQIFEAMGVELEKRAERYALCTSRASFGHPACEDAEGVERDSGHVRPLAGKRISHWSSPSFRSGRGGSARGGGDQERLAPQLSITDVDEIRACHSFVQQIEFIYTINTGDGETR
jgi:hypothetical protein